MIFAYYQKVRRFVVMKSRAFILLSLYVFLTSLGSAEYQNLTYLELNPDQLYLIQELELDIDRLNAQIDSAQTFNDPYEVSMIIDRYNHVAEDSLDTNFILPEVVDVYQTIDRVDCPKDIELARRPEIIRYEKQLILYKSNLATIHRMIMHYYYLYDLNNEIIQHGR